MARTRLEHALLGLLSMEPQAGYDLVRIFETTPMGHFSGSPGAIYPALDRLAEEGLLSARVEGRGARPRRVFSVTEDGLQVLDAWLTAPIGVEDVRDDLDLLFLRFAMAERRVGTEGSLTFLTELRTAVAEYLLQVRAQAAEMRRTPFLHPVLTLEHGIESLETTLGWIDRALRAVEDAGDASGSQSPRIDRSGS